MSDTKKYEGLENNSKVSIEEEQNEESNIQEETKALMHTLHVSNGPFFLSAIIKDLPEKLNYTCCESYGEHIYLGTQTGELLHYFEIETGNYLLVSRIKFDDSKTGPVDKIILFPSIERAGVLSQGVLTLFLLPELAPVPNSKGLENINDVQIIKNNTINNIIVFSPDCGAIYQVYDNSFNLLKKFHNLRDVRTSLVKKDKLVVAQNNEYMIFDMLTNKEIPLFKVSETTNNTKNAASCTLTPIIADFSPNEVLVCSGGLSYKNEAMALVINLDGDISQGTIALKSYPRDIIVCFPYVIVNIDFQEINIFKLVNNDNPILIQTMKYNDINNEQLTDIRLMSNKVSKLFHSDAYLANADDTILQKIDQIVDKLRSSPLVISSDELNMEIINESPPTTIEYRIDREKAFIKDIMNFSTNILFYDNFAVYETFQIPFFIELKDFNEIEIVNIENYLSSKSGDIQLGKFQQVELKYLKLLHHLLVLLHCDIIDKNIIKLWCRDMKYIDIRTLLYLFDLIILGECWCPNGLLSFINKLKSLKIINKLNSQSEILNFLKIIKRYIIKRFSNDKDFNNYDLILITLDVNIFMQQSNSEIKIDLDDFEEISLNAIIETIKDKKMVKHKPLLIEIYIKQGMFDNVIGLLKEDKKYSDLLDFLIANVENLTNDYKQNNILSDLVTIITNDRSLYDNDDKNKNDNEVIKKTLKLMSDIHMDYHAILDLIDNVSLKVHILEIIGIENRQDKGFLMEYYIEKLYKIVLNGNLSSNLEKVINEYQNDLHYSKPNILEYMKLKFKYDPKFSTFRTQYERIIKLCKGDDHLLNQLYENIIKFNKDDSYTHDILVILLLFYYEDGDVSKRLTCRYLNDKQLLHLAMKYNDFKEVDKRIDKINILEVLRWVTHIAGIPFSSELICKILVKHRQIYENDRSVILEMVRNIIPKESPVAIISPFLISILHREKFLAEDVTLRKMLLKSELNRYNEVLSILDKTEEKK